MSRTGLIRLCALACVLLACFVSCKERERNHGAAPVECEISLEGRELGSATLLCGYNHMLLRRFAESHKRPAAISLARSREAALDSLRNGNLDIVVLPYIDSLPPDSTLVTIGTDSCGLWVFSAEASDAASDAASWFKKYRKAPDYAIVRQPYFDLYNPLKRVSADFISPYDSLIRAYADTLGWDWKLLAALIYQESKFRIEARSQAGAAGLMQLLPDTARHFGCTDILDPESSIAAGAKMLLALRERYKGLAANEEELTKFTLAAYNAGSGRLKDCINHARHMHKDVAYWENVASVIPQMQDDSVAALGHIKHGRFNGRETVGFVRQIFTYSKRYHHICP